MKVYIAGPMTGYVEHNFPAFKAAAARLRALGYQVVNPAELDEPLGLSHEELSELPHEFFLRRDIEALLDCEGIYTLPGWRHSKGATLEVAVAKGCGILRVKDHDLELWRTFEGEPLIEDHSYCEPVQGDGRGNSWCAHGETVTIANPEGCTELTCPKHGEANRKGAEDEMDLAEVIELHTTRPEVEVPLWARGHSVPQPGDRFPNVAYVRDLTGRTAAELAEVARQSFTSEQFVRGTE